MLPAIIGAAAPAIIGAISGMFGKSQYDKQKDLMGLQMQGSKEMIDYQKNADYEMWKKTNMGAQKEELQKAGMNPALMYGLQGGGGATTGGTSGVSGAQAADDAATMNAKTNMLGLATQAANIELMKSQARKNNVDADVAAGVKTEETKQGIEESKARVTAQEFQNEMNKLFGWQNKHADTMKNEISAERANLDNEMYKAVAWGSGNATDENNTAFKALKAQFDKNVTDLENAKKEGRIADAETIIREFGAEMAKEGLAPNSPWYVKMIDTMLNKAGIHVTDTSKYIK